MSYYSDHNNSDDFIEEQDQFPYLNPYEYWSL